MIASILTLIKNIIQKAFMKKNLLTILFLFVSLYTLSAQEWHKDFAEAKKLAAAQHKPIILVFQGSDWCAPCIKLDRSVWSTNTFKAYAKDHYIMVQADFPRKKSNSLTTAQVDANKKLAEIYNKNGIFPLVVVLDKAGNVLGETSYKKLSPENYIKDLNTFIK